jgi:hypothetical protein
MISPPVVVYVRDRTRRDVMRNFGPGETSRLTGVGRQCVIARQKYGEIRR